MKLGKLGCWAVENLIEVYSDGRLADSQSAWVKGHIDACRDCSEAFGELQGLKRLLRRPSAAQAPSGLAEAIAKASKGAPAGVRLPEPAPLTSQAAVLLYLSALVVAVQVFPGVDSQALSKGGSGRGRTPSAQARPWEVQ